ncbi:MAG: sugar ABC transporter permease [Elusimicrobiota bacterium]
MKKNIAYFFCLPALLLIFAVAFYPILNALWLSLHSMNLKMAGGSEKFVGLNNFLSILKDDRAWTSLLQTLIFTISSVGLEFILGFGIALLLNEVFFGRGAMRAISLVPWAIPTVVSGLLWLWIFNDQYGIFSKFGSIMSKPTGAMASLIISDVWKTTPFVSILLLAGLQMISRELYEAAKIDGATKFKQFLYVTLPLLKPIIIVTLLFRTLDAFRIFDLVYVMTGGGPGNSTETLSLYTYKVLFSYLDFGYGSSLSVFTFFCVALISFCYLIFLRRSPEC